MKRVAVTSLVLLATAAAFAQSQLKAMERARDSKNYTQMEQICRSAVQGGDRSEYMMRSWSWALCRLDRTEEGLQVARQNYDLNPCAWSMIQIAEAAADDGQFSLAKDAVKFLKERESQLGNLKKTYEFLRDRLSSKTYLFTQRIAAPANGRAIKRRIVIPQQDRVQTSVVVRVMNGLKYKEESTIDGIKYLIVDQPASTAFEVTFEVTFTPFSWKPMLKNFDASAPLPKEAGSLLGKSSDKDFLAVDPTTPLVRQLVKPLIGKNDIETAKNIMNWVEKSIPWTAVDARLNSETTLSTRKGSCTPRSFSAIALFRAAGIPARAWRGYSGVDAKTKHPGAHTIPQFYLRGVGWVDSDFGVTAWQAPTWYLRMYYRASNDYGVLGDSIDPAKDCDLKLLRSEL